MYKKKNSRLTLPKLVLASSSLVRKELFDHLRLSYCVYPSQFTENIPSTGNKSYSEVAKQLAFGKAQDVASKIKSHSLVIGIDSFAVLDGKILGKPKTRERAIEFLSVLSGKTHDFYTGMAVIDMYKQRKITHCAKAKVYFRNLSLTEITQYIQKEEVLTAAGSYRIQGLGSTFIKKIEGDYYAVVGVSPSKLAEMFKELGYNLFDYVRG